MKIVGIDPGHYGAIALIDPEEFTLDVWDMPIQKVKPGAKTKTQISWLKVGRILDDTEINRAYIEEVNARPGEGIVSAFTFGGNYWGLVSACAVLQIPYVTVRPAVWKKNLKVPAAKDGAIAKASMLMPRCEPAWDQKKDGRAEAALIGLYGLMAMGFIIMKPIELVNINGEKI